MKAFDRVPRDTQHTLPRETTDAAAASQDTRLGLLWRVLLRYGVPPKLVRLLIAMHRRVLVELDVGLIADDDDVYVADDDPPKAHVQRGAAGTPAGRVTVEPRSDTIAAFVDGSRRLPEFGGAFGSPADVASDRTTVAGVDGRPEAGAGAGAKAGADLGARMAQLSTPRAQPPAPAAVAPPSPAAPASPLDELLARHLKLGRGRPTAGGGEGDAKEDWRERYRRRRNPFASFAANDAKLAVDASQQTPGFAMLHSG